MPLFFQLHHGRAVAALVLGGESVARDVGVIFQECVDEVFECARADAVDDADALEAGEIGFV